MAHLKIRARFWFKNCKEEDRLGLMTCMGQNWENFVTQSFKKWSDEPLNKGYKNHRSLFIMRAQNNSKRIRREIASQPED